MISFKVTQDDADLINKIVDRLLTMKHPDNGRRFFSQALRMDLVMDFTATHANGCALRLSELLAADEFNFAHDALGIRRHLNRKTGKLENCFLPRFAA